MAMQKDIVLLNGIKTKYHKLDLISYNFVEEAIMLHINHYTSKKVRDNLTKLDELNESIDKLSEQVNEAIANSNYSLAEALKQKLSLKVAQAQELENKEYKAGDTSMLIKGIPSNLSMTHIYDMLTDMDKFSNARKV